MWQNRGVEGFLRDLRKMAADEGVEVNVRAVATSQTRMLNGGAGDSFLSHVEYRFSLVRPNGKSASGGHVEFSVGAPPASRVHDVHVALGPGPRAEVAGRSAVANLPGIG